MPNYASSGLSDSKVPDVQAGWENAFTTGLAVMGGNNYIHHAAGMLESMQCVAHELYVLDDKIIGQTCKTLEGISTNEDHLAFEDIRDVGPGGNYLLSPHTMRYLRSEYFQGNGVSDRARTITRAILDKPLVPKINSVIEQEIRRYFTISLWSSVPCGLSS